MSYISLQDTQDYVCSITPEEFEIFCVELLKSYAKEENLADFTIEHNVKIASSDGTYQIDAHASFTAMGVTVKVLCECKQYKNKVKREKVQILADKLRSLGMNKGILLSTSGFQKGAIDYAKEHGIALIQVFDHSCEPVSHSGGLDVNDDENDPMLWGEKHWPKYKAVCLLPEADEPVVVYPPKEMIEGIYQEMAIRAEKMYGITIGLPEK